MSVNYHDALIPYLYEGVYVVDHARKIIFWNEACERITGYQASEVKNSYCYHNILQHVDQEGKMLCLEGCPLQDTLTTGDIHEAHVFLRHKQGYRVPVMVRTLPVYDEDQKIVAAIEVFTDERYQKQVYEENIELKDKLKTDELTKIGNRQFFDFQFNKRLEEAKAFNNPFGILMIDIDRFKNVNDTYGHLVGDEILKMVSNSLASNVLSHELVCRWGGEEFVALIEVKSLEALKEAAERLRLVVQASSYRLDDGTILSVTVSLGGTLIYGDEEAKDVLARADKNLYAAKDSGRNQTKLSG